MLTLDHQVNSKKQQIIRYFRDFRFKLLEPGRLSADQEADIWCTQLSPVYCITTLFLPSRKLNTVAAHISKWNINLRKKIF